MYGARRYKVFEKLFSEDILCKYEKIHHSKKIFLAPFQTETKSEVKLDYFRVGYQRKSLDKTYHIHPRDFKAYAQNISLMSREYSIIRMLTTGELVKRVI